MKCLHCCHSKNVCFVYVTKFRNIVCCENWKKDLTTSSTTNYHLNEDSRLNEIELDSYSQEIILPISLKKLGRTGSTYWFIRCPRRARSRSSTFVYGSNLIHCRGNGLSVFLSGLDFTMQKIEIWRRLM